jgi:Ca2+-binding EF-hand superfamily protein
MSCEDLDRLLTKLELPLVRAYLVPVFRAFDRDNKGFIDYEQFERFILSEPF